MSAGPGPAILRAAPESEPAGISSSAAPPARDLLALATLAGATVLILFLLWEGTEQSMTLSASTRTRVHYARGISTSLLTGLVVGTLAWRQHRRRAEELETLAAASASEARETRCLLQLVVDSTPAALVVLDRDFRVVKANRTAERVHGRGLEGHRCFEAIAACSQMCRECPAADSFESGAPSKEARSLTDPRTGEVLAVESHPLELPDGRRFVLLVERIITEQRKLQARLVHQEKMAAFGLLAAGVAHDLGNPLASIEVQLQLLDESRFPSESAGVMRTVRQEVARLRRILRELIDFARRRRDEASLVSVQSVTEDALRLLRHDHRMRSVKTSTVFDPETPSVSVVEDHLMQVVLNLLINALDAMPGGGTLRIEVQGAGRSVALRVHDSGVGMDRHVLAHCMEPLFTTKAPGHGTGLGLSISRDILRAIGGDIELHSVPGHGTTAVVTLPAAVVAGGASEGLREPVTVAAGAAS